MNMHTRFRCQSEQDIRSSYKLHCIKDYGNAAFLAQQALEKAFKSVMMRYELVDQSTVALKKLSHKPIVALLDMHAKYAKEFEPKNDAEDRIRSACKKFLPVLQNLFKAPPTAAITDEMWWQISLGIRLPPKEEEKIQLCIQNHLINLTIILQQIKNIIEKINREKNNKQISDKVKQIKTLLNISLNKLKRDPAELSITKCLKEQHIVENALHDLLIFVHNNKKLDKKIGGIIIMSIWIISHSLILFKIAPHEDLGRYPIDIHGDNTLPLYRQNNEQLFSLIGEVEKATQSLHAL